jgi:malate dehydrogenase
MTITIIGSGKVGASVALNCGIRDLDDLLLIDIIQGLPQGEAMDINHQLSEMGIDRLVRGSNNYADMSDSGIVVLVAGLGRKPGMTRMDLLQTNANIVRDVSMKIICTKELEKLIDSKAKLDHCNLVDPQMVS